MDAVKKILGCPKLANTSRSHMGPTYSICGIFGLNPKFPKNKPPKMWWQPDCLEVFIDKFARHAKSHKFFSEAIFIFSILP
jgi:hypothetical protein